MDWQYTKENPLRVVTLCSGYESQCMAIRDLGIPFDLVAWAEFDPESKAPLEKQPAVIAHNAVFPEYADRNLGDMTKIDWEKVPDFDLLFYSTPCFVAGTLVLTESGYKPIEEVVEGERVLTHMNRYREVITPMCHDHYGKMYHITAMSHDGIDCTPEHPFYVRRRARVWDGPARRWRRVFSSPEWVEAKDLTKDCYLGVAINQESKMPDWNGVSLYYGGNESHVNTLSALLHKMQFWYLMGRYVGDGWSRDDDHKAVNICCGGRNRDELVGALSSCGFNPTITKERGVERFTVYSKELVEFVRRYGKYAHGKHIDPETLNLPTDLLESFLVGYEDSDGCKNGKYRQFSSVSKELAYGICQIIAKVKNRPYKLYRCNMPKTTVIEGRAVNQRDFYVFSYKGETGKQDQAFYDSGYVWFPISKIESYDWYGPVYNLHVAEDNSYTANGTIVHNCQSISNAGLQHGFVEGSGTRSSIIWNVRDAVKVKRPRICILENVKAMVSDKFVGMFNLWQAELHKFGYTNFPQVLNAKDFGIPQNRERIFLVSIHGDAWFNFPQPQELKLKLKDVLEENVDEKYYLDDLKVAGFIDSLEREKVKKICGE